MTSMGQRAAFLADKGFAVFPIYTVDTVDGVLRCSCGKQCGSPGKHPIGPLVPRGCLEATTDKQLIKEWWATYPDANIGIATGDASGVFVLDIDIDTGGDETLTTLEERFDRLPDTVAVWTGSGGMHFYFRMPGVEVKNSAGAVGPGIDVRGTGGYVVAPTSKHIGGGTYTWNEALHPRDTPIADAPEWLIERIAPKASGAASTAPIPTKIPEGMRNHWLASAAGTMRRRGFCEDAIAAALVIENTRRCAPPLTENEVRKIARSIERYTPERTLRFGNRAA
jgi:putative DNA primase/helicase